MIDGKQLKLIEELYWLKKENPSFPVIAEVDTLVRNINHNDYWLGTWESVSIEDYLYEEKYNEERYWTKSSVEEYVQNNMIDEFIREYYGNSYYKDMVELSKVDKAKELYRLLSRLPWKKAIFIKIGKFNKEFNEV